MNKIEHFLTEYYEGISCQTFARGTTGLYALFSALRQVKTGREVIIPAICCETVAMAAIYAGLTPVIVDVDRKNLCLSISSVVEKLSEATLAIVLVYIFGNIFDIGTFKSLRDMHDIILIEDIAQATGGIYADQEVGKHFDFTLLSFDDTKILQGKGGAVIQRNPMLGDMLRIIETSFPSSPAPHILHPKELSLRNLTHALFDIARAMPHHDISSTFLNMMPLYKDIFVRKENIVHEELILKQFKNLQTKQARRYEKYVFYKDHIMNNILQVIEFPSGSMCWRVPVLVDNPVNTFYITKLLRQHHILVSNHYFPLDKLLYNSQHPKVRTTGPRILNLWVDDLMTIENMKKTVELLNSYHTVMA